MTNFCVSMIPVLMLIGYGICRADAKPSQPAPLEGVTNPAIAERNGSPAPSDLPTITPELLRVTRQFLSTGSVNLKHTTLEASINASEIDDGDGIQDDGWNYENTTYVDTRRILYSKSVPPGRRPYMVYLQLTKESAKAHKYRGWLCGGVIVDKNYVLTSAACVEDADRFYIVSGTVRFIDSFDYKNNDCVCKHRRKVVWKCIPKNYKFDFQDSIKWSSNDIAVVKVDKPFKLGVLEKGCEFPVDVLPYNNVSRELEKPSTKAFIAGWGSGTSFREGVYRRQKVHIPENAKCLQEAKVCIMDNQQCAKKWAQRFRSIITQYMICTKDVMKRLSEICEKKYANCTDVPTRKDIEPSSDVGQKVWNVDLGRHFRDPDDYTARRAYIQGGFCENDHGGPLIVKYQGKERVIGVISACKIDPKSHSCHGPFLYTSVFKNRQFISCAINKDTEDNCRRVFRTGVTHEEWSVNWDDYKDDDTNKAEEADKEDSEDDTEKPALRELTKEEEDKKHEKEKEKESEERKETAKDDDDAVEEDSSSAEADTTIKSTTLSQSTEKPEVKLEATEVIHKIKGKKPKSKKHEKKEEGKHPVRTDSKETKHSKEEDSELKDTRAQGSYESSRDDTVNEPEE